MLGWDTQINLVELLKDMMRLDPHLFQKDKFLKDGG